MMMIYGLLLCLLALVTTNTEAQQESSLNIIDITEMNITVRIDFEYLLLKSIVLKHKSKFREKLQETKKVLEQKTAKYFQYPNLNVNMTLNIKQKYLTEEANIVPSNEADVYLTNYCLWAADIKSDNIASDTWEFSVLLNSYGLFMMLDGYQREKSLAHEYYKVPGYVFKEGFCESTRSCAIIPWSDDLNKIAHYLARVLALSMGMKFDGSNNCENPNGGKLAFPPMALPENTSTVIWSTCNKAELNMWLWRLTSGQQSTCFHLEYEN